MKNIFIILSCFFSAAAFAQDYDVKLISDALKKNANAVKRAEDVELIIKSPSKAIIKTHYAVTILNEAGEKEAVYENWYNKMRSLENISGRLYDASGKQLRSVKKKDIGDFSAHDESSLMTDDRMKQHNFFYSVYPYTVEYEDEVVLDGLFFLPAWRPLGNTWISTEQSSFMVEAPADMSIRYKQIAMAEPPLQTMKDGKKIYSWHVKDLAAVVPEPYQPDWKELNPAVYVAPSKFEVEDYKGDMSSWKTLGDFINLLNNNRQQLPENIKQDVHRLTDKISDPKEKINILYGYMQQNTRYISVQLGIGSWQPFDANYVATKKYGDCKALSNYMVSLLKEANIKADYVLVTAGENKSGLWEDFPSPYFNHAIICVPQDKDSIWLECTSQTSSTGYMGSFTENRKALLIDETGGHVVNTPVYKASDNLQLRKIDASIDNLGNLTAQVYTRFTGVQQEDVHDMMYGATPEQKQRYLNNTLMLPTYSVEKYEYHEKKNIVPEMDEMLAITSPSYATITGKRLFITPNFFNRSSSKPPEDKDRKYDIQFHSSFIDADTIQIKIPADYTVEAMPKPVRLETPYGNYSISFSMHDNTINVLRKNERSEGRFPRSEYEAVATYLNDIYKADRSRVVLVRKDN